MKKLIFRGAATALITPFKEGKVDYDALSRLLEDQIAAKIGGLVICGTTGESATMTDREKIDTVAFSVKQVNGRVPVIAGAGSNNTAHSIELCRAACDAGADALLIVTPYYNKTSQTGLVRMYTAIADEAGAPLILYNVPSRTGVNIEPSTYAILADHPNINAIKEANGNISSIAETASLVKDKIALYCGNDDQIVPMLALGAQGVISVLSNVLPKETSEICDLFFEGKVSESAALQLRMIPLIKALFSDVNPIPVKEAMAMLCYCTGELRLPLVPMSDEKREILRRRLREAGLAV